ncbi:interactor protein for cytohesin exchange factors 1 isoform 2-T3 [Polymixia lowei]
MSRRRVSVKELGELDCQGWLYRRKESRGFLGNRWKRYWFVLKRRCLYWYASQTAEQAEGFVDLADFTIQQAADCRRKHAMKASHPQVVTIFIAAESFIEMKKWISKLSAAAIQTKPSEQNSGECYSEGSDQETEEGVTSCPLYTEQLSTDFLADTIQGDVPPPPRTSSPFHINIPASPPYSRTTSESSEPVPPRQTGSWLDLPTPEGAWGGAEPPPFLGSGDRDWLEVENSQREQVSTSGETELLHLKRASYFPIGRARPSNKKDCRASFSRRCKDEKLNEKLHLVRILNSTIKAKEADLLAIEQVLTQSTLTADQYRQWRLSNFILLQEITQRKRPAGGARGPPVRSSKELYETSV